MLVLGHQTNCCHVVILILVVFILKSTLGQVCNSPSRPYQGKVTYSGTGVNDTAVYTCNSGTYMMSPGYSIAVCNASGDWLTVEGTDSDWLFCTEYGRYFGCMTLSNSSTLTEMDPITNSLPKDNLDDCLRACKNLGHFYIARMGELCYCTNTIKDHVTASPCDDWCYDNRSYCGAVPERYSVYRSTDKCVDIQDTSNLPTSPLPQVRTGYTCVQLCLARDYLLSFYKNALEECYCLNEIPPYEWTSTTCGNIAVNANKTFDRQALEITELSTRATSCEDLFSKGVFYHGTYLLDDGNKVTCHFYDSSTSCDRDWVAYNGECYRFLTTMANASESFEGCRQDDSQLLTLTSQQQMNFLRIFSNMMRPPHAEDFYIGLYDTQAEFTYMWADETRVAFRPFQAGYPFGLEASCIKWTGKSNAILNVPCGDNGYAICNRREAIPGCMRVPAHLHVASALNSSSMSIPLCFEVCRSQGNEYSATRHTYCYCYADVSSFTKLPWDNCDISCPVHKFQICGGSEEDVVFVTKDYGQDYRSGCQEMILEGLATTVTTANETSQTTQVRNCSEEAGEKCPEYWLEIDGHCYRYFRESSRNPFHSCLELGGYVAVFETPQEQDSILQIIRDFPTMDDAIDHWLFGLRFVRGDASYLRYSNGAWLNTTKTAGATGPDSNVQCLALTSGGQMVNITVDCTTNAFICEKDDSVKGCCLYSDVPGNVIVIENFSEMTVRLCMEACKPTGLRYAGLKQASTCVCTNDVLKSPNGTSCNAFCAGFQGCGSSQPEFMSVYTVDYSYNASTCEELFHQGVLLNGYYTLGIGVNTWCGMIDSDDLAQYAKICNASRNCDASRYFVGINDSLFSVDIAATVQYTALNTACEKRFVTASIPVNVRVTWVMDLIIDVLRWLLEVPNSVPTFIGAVDEFNMGIYSWSDGDIFRMSDLGMNQPLAYGEARSLHLVMNHQGTLLEAPVSTELKYHATCQLDTTFVDCYMASNVSALSPFESVSNYQSISIGLCRQVCQGQNKTQVFVSSTSCICYDPDSSHDAQIMALMTSSSDDNCDVACPANRYQLCGASPFYRHYQFDPDYVKSCQELYDNFIVYNATYVINRTLAICGLDDKTVNCGPGFISYKEKCYRFQRRQDLKLSQASTVCRDLSSYLASPTSEQEQDDLKYLISQFTELSTADIWYLGFYRTFVPGYYSSASGNMHLDLLSETPRFNDNRRAIALNLTSSLRISVSEEDKYSFICETSGVQRGTAKLSSDGDVPEFSLPSGMSVHQCVTGCQGLGLNATLVAVNQQTCRCLVSDQTIINWGQQSTKTCAGHPLQICGGDHGDVFTVYAMAFFPSRHLNHSCDDLFSFGVVLPRKYTTDHKEIVECFKLSAKTDYVMASIASVNLNPSATASGDPRLQVSHLDLGGWQGQVQDAMYVQVDLEEYFVLEGLVLIDALTNVQTRFTLSVSFDGLHFQDSGHGQTVVGPDTRFVWLTLSKPLVCRIVKLTFIGAQQPSISFEMLGYPYTSHSFDERYLGCHLETGNEVRSQASAATYNQCCDVCQQMDFSMVAIDNTDSCFCVKSNYTRDLYDHGHCQDVCFNRTDIRCENETSEYYAVYNTIDFECKPFTINNTDVVETAVTNSSLVNVTTATTFTFDCQKGFQFNQSSTSSVSTQCYNFGVWIPSVSSYDCVRVDCGQPPNPVDSKINSTVTGTLYGDTVNYTCNNGIGWAFDGSQDQFQITCQEDENWGPTIPSCSLRKCPSPSSVTSATIQDSQTDYVYGDSVTYQCDDGCHFLPETVTNRTIACLSTGQWEDVPSECTRFRCSIDPPPLTHSTFEKDGLYDARYVCEKGAEFADRIVEQNVTCNQTSFLWPSIAPCQPVLSLQSHTCPIHLNKRLDNPYISEVTTRSLMDCALQCLANSLCYRFSHPKLDSYETSHPFTRCLLSLDGQRQMMSDFSLDSEWNTYILGDSC